MESIVWVPCCEIAVVLPWHCSGELAAATAPGTCLDFSRCGAESRGDFGLLNFWHPTRTLACLFVCLFVCLFQSTSNRKD